jgi:hypothetical protein
VRSDGGPELSGKSRGERPALGETRSFNAFLDFWFHEPRGTATDRMSVGEVDLPRVEEAG